MPGWKSYDNIETEYLQNIHLHLFSSSFIDYSDERVANFIRQYREKYSTEPEKDAFQGFDITMFFSSALKKFGSHFPKCIDKVKGHFLQSDYQFIQSNENDGYENSFLNIYRYEDYQFVNVRTHPKIKENEKKLKKN